MSETNTLERADVVRGAALAAAGLVGATLLAGRRAEAATAAHVTFYFSANPGANNTTVVQVPQTATNYPTASTEVQVVNFALAAETIEADLYRQVLARLTNGQNPDGSPATDGLGNPITGLGLGTDQPDVSYFTEFIQVETAQRDTLATVLYGSAAANPFLPSAAGFKYAFGVPAFDRVAAARAIYESETRGVYGYLVGAKALPIGSQFLPLAAAALGVEGRHAAIAAAVLTGLGVTFETAPLASQNNGREYPDPVTPDQLLYGQTNVPGGPPNGTFTIPPVSGPSEPG